MAQSNTEKYHYVKRQIQDTQAKASDAKRILDWAENEIKFLTAWHDELAKDICASCSGYGKIREWLAQDESQLITCVRCNGRGVKPNAIR